jgi:hypothetical protein
MYVCVCVLHTKRERERAKIHFSFFFLVRMNNFYSYLGYSRCNSKKNKKKRRETTNMYFTIWSRFGL